MSVKEKVMETTKQKLKPTKAQDIEKIDFKSYSTTFPIVDDLWSFQGGIVEGRLTYLTGSSGAGKTTFITQLQSNLKNVKTGQLNYESLVALVKSRNPNFDYHSNFYMDDKYSVNSIDEYLEMAEVEGIRLIIVDSGRAAANEIDQANAEVVIAKKLMKWVNRTGGNVILIGMVTKDDTFAGKNEIMHYVDAHLHMQFDKSLNERYMYFDQKNRDGELLKKVYYQFRKDGKGIEFFSEEEWFVRKRGLKMYELIQNTMQAFISGWKNHPNYNKFRNELSDAQNQLVKTGDFSNQTSFQAAFMIACQELVDKHFS